MNYRMIKNVIGWILLFEAGFFLIPMVTALVYAEKEIFSFGLSALICMAAASILIFVAKPKSKTLYSREGFVIVSLSWIFLSLFGALPFVFSNTIPNYVDALFETVSGFSTTGASILPAVEHLPRSILMWRSFTHWVGGMGVLVFIMAFLPLGGGGNMHIMKAESTGASVSKLVPRIKTTALILYTIYLSLTLLQFILLLCGGMSVFESINTAFATAGTGGFGIKNDSMNSYSSYLQIVTAVFMLLFSINFSSYYLAIRGRFKNAFNAEVRGFIVIVVTAVALITLNIRGMFDSLFESFKHSLFTVASIISTSGFSTVDFDLWPELSKTVIVLIMFIGACAGSTGGGIKVSRMIILVKGAFKELSQMLHPKQVKKVTMDKRPVEHEVVRSVNAYIVCFVLIFVVSLVLISFDNKGLVTNFTAVTSMLNNIGPGLSEVGPTQNYASFSVFSKIVLIFDMLAGRLELFPMLLLFKPGTWKK
ncbi:MAG: TrkH family potassium uptake protein [Clostridia bacterium]|nr:TrkH family potassium uptake protein [Clostridia bacterium]